MKGSTFAQTYGPKGIAAWEAAAVDLAQKGDVVPWPASPVTVTDGTHTLTFHATDDYFAVGEGPDILRLPLTPKAAQAVADATGMTLPTTRMVREIHRQAQNKLAPHPIVPNNGASMSQYVAHSTIIDGQKAGRSGLTSGQKKDVVVGDALKPGKVVIYGWGRRDDPPLVETPSTLWSDSPNVPESLWRVQPYSNVHGDFYVDYSHGIRLISPTVLLDGTEGSLASVLKDPQLSKLLLDTGPLRDDQLRYGPVPGAAAKKPWYVPSKRRLVDLGRDTAIEQYEHQRALKTGS